MTDELMSELVRQAPNFVGLLIAIYLQRKTIQDLITTNSRLVEAMIRRENCGDDEGG